MQAVSSTTCRLLTLLGICIGTDHQRPRVAWLRCQIAPTSLDQAVIVGVLTKVELAGRPARGPRRRRLAAAHRTACWRLPPRQRAAG